MKLFHLANRVRRESWRLQGKMHLLWLSMPWMSDVNMMPKREGTILSEKINDNFSVLYVDFYGLRAGTNCHTRYSWKLLKLFLWKSSLMEEKQKHSLHALESFEKILLLFSRTLNINIISVTFRFSPLSLIKSPVFLFHGRIFILPHRKILQQENALQMGLCNCYLFGRICFNF